MEGSEDCLYLNVYVPDRNKGDAPIPVLFWIHGGCFLYGTGSVFGAKYLADKDVILVTINYRLGSLGNSYFYFWFQFNYIQFKSSSTSFILFVSNKLIDNFDLKVFSALKMKLFLEIWDLKIKAWHCDGFIIILRDLEVIQVK